MASPESPQTPHEGERLPPDDWFDLLDFDDEVLPDPRDFGLDGFPGDEDADET